MSNLRKVELDQVSEIGNREFLDVNDRESIMVMKEILSELRVLKAHVESITGERITERDIK